MNIHLSTINKILKDKAEASEMVQLVKAYVETHTVEEENWFWKIVLWHPHTWHKTHIHLNVFLKNVRVKFLSIKLSCVACEMFSWHLMIAEYNIKLKLKIEYWTHNSPIQNIDLAIVMQWVKFVSFLCSMCPAVQWPDWSRKLGGWMQISP